MLCLNLSLRKRGIIKTYSLGTVQKSVWKNVIIENVHKLLVKKERLVRLFDALDERDPKLRVSRGTRGRVDEKMLWERKSTERVTRVTTVFMDSGPAELPADDLISGALSQT